MTPIEYAQALSDSGEYKLRVLGVAMIIRGLTDDSDGDPWRLAWPLDEATARRAARYLNLDPTPELVNDALKLAPTLSDAILNKEAN